MLVVAVLRSASNLAPKVMEGVGKIWMAYANAKVRELNQRATEAPEGIDPLEHARNTVAAPKSVKESWSMADFKKYKDEHDRD